MLVPQLLHKSVSLFLYLPMFLLFFKIILNISSLVFHEAFKSICIVVSEKGEWNYAALNIH